MTQKTLSKCSESNQREREQSDFVIPSEPKILCLVFEVFPYTDAVTSKKKSDIVSPGYKNVPRAASPECQIFPREIRSVYQIVSRVTHTDYKMQLVLCALGTKIFFRLQALVTRRYCGAVSLNYKKVPWGCQPSVPSCN